MNESTQWPLSTVEHVPSCSCYSITKNDGVIYPVLCSAHQREYQAAVDNRIWRYQRYFETESDARDRKRILERMYPHEGYGTEVYVRPVGRWFLVLASWGSAD